jgi:hypothetical protein
MKRLITALAVAIFASPAGALAVPPHFSDHGAEDAAAPAARTQPVIAKRLPASGTDVAAPDQQSPIGGGAPAPASSGSDFDWSDAGLGAGGAICLAAASLASATAFRRRHVRRTSLT